VLGFQAENGDAVAIFDDVFLSFGPGWHWYSAIGWIFMTAESDFCSMGCPMVSPLLLLVRRAAVLIYLKALRSQGWHTARFTQGKPAKSERRKGGKEEKKMAQIKPGQVWEETVSVAERVRFTVRDVIGECAEVVDDRAHLYPFHRILRTDDIIHNPKMFKLISDPINGK
jgi:hypothetical protein